MSTVRYKTILRKTLFALAAVAICGAANAKYPDKPIRLILPFNPGATVDIVARLIAPKMSALLGQQVIVDNRPGAGGIVATELVARAAPDGYTLLMVTTSHSAIPAIKRKLPYDVKKDFTSIGLVTDEPGIIVVNAKLPVKTFQELLAYAKTHDVSFSSAGNGTFPHLGMELLKSRAHVPMLHVPYTGAAPAMNDLLGGRVDLKLDAYPTSAAQIKAGRLRAVAVTSLKRLPELPDVPTVDESGFPGYQMTFWMGIVAPAGLPKPILDTLQAAVSAAALDPATQQAFKKQGLQPLGKPAGDLDALIDKEMAQWKALAKAGVLVPE